MTEIVCVRACVHVCVRVCVNIDVFLTLLYYHDQDAKSSYNVMIDSHIVLLCIQLLFLTYCCGFRSVPWAVGFDLCILFVFTCDDR